MLSNVLADIRWLGHDGFQLRSDNTTIVIDPYQVDAASPADIILVTHPHHDHCSPADVEKLLNADGVIVTETESAQKLSGDIRVMAPGDELTLTSAGIRAVPAYNVDKQFHPKAKNWLGFIITIDGVRIYHAGDTDLIEEMGQMEVDIALLPVSGTYVMTADEAVQAAKGLRPKVAIPMHYGSVVGSAADARRFKEGLEGVCEVVVPGA